MTQVSFFEKITKTTDPRHISLFEVIEQIRNGTYQEPVSHLRKRKIQGAEKEELEEIKKGLPLFTTSGTFNARKASEIISHSGKIAIDFDNISPTEIEGVRSILANDQYTEYLFYSCSGGGLCAIVNIDPAKHLESFKYLESYYKDHYGLTIDQSCKDVVRARFVSYDPALIYNTGAIMVELPTNIAPISPPANDDGLFAPVMEGLTVESDEEKYAWAVKVHEKKESFTEGNRHHYLVVLAFFLNKLGVSESYATSQFLTHYEGNGMGAKEIQSIVSYCYKNINDFGTFAINKKLSEIPEAATTNLKAIYRYAYEKNEEGVQWNDDDVHFLGEKHLLPKTMIEDILKNVFEKNKDAFGIAKKPEIAQIEYFIKKRYEIKLNVVTQRIEAKERNSSEPLGPLNIDTLYREIQHAGFKFSLEKIKSLIKSNYVQRYDPIRTYFESLPDWDHEEEIDYIDHLAGYLETDNQEFWKTQFKKALVRSIACSLDGDVNRIIMTLVQEAQETGKSEFLRFLCPPELKPYYSEEHMNDKDKDTELQLSENFIWNMEELSGLANNEINKLKATISKSQIKQRRAYAAYHEVNPRRVNFWASTNKSEFLTDDSNTRWLCFNVKSVNHNYRNKATGVCDVNIKNVWAQAYALYKSGFAYHLTKEERDLRDQNNRAYEQSSAEKEIILQHFKPASAPTLGDPIDPNTEFASTTEITLKLIALTDNKLKFNHFAIGRAMRQLGFTPTKQKRNGKEQRGFWIKQTFQGPSYALELASDSNQGAIPFTQDEKPPF